MRRPTRWHRKILSAYGFAVAVIASSLLLVGFHLVENWRGDRAWAGAQSRLRTAGEPLTIAEWLTPPPPDGQNFMMNAVFVRRFGIGLPKPFTPEPWEREPGGRTSVEDLSSSFDYEALGANDGSARLDLPALAAGVPPFAPGDSATEVEAAKAVLRWTDQWKEDFDALARATRERPDHYLPLSADISQWTGRWDGLESWVDGGKILQLRALAQIGLGDATGARDSILISLRMAEAAAAEPTQLIGMVSGTAITSLALRPLNEGLRRRLWSKGELHELDAAMSRLKTSSAIQRALRSERLFLTALLEPGTANRDWTLVLQFPPNSFASIIARLCPRGWLRQNQAKLADWQLRHHDRLDQPVFQRPPAEEPPLFVWHSPYKWMASFASVGTKGLESMADEVDCHFLLARTVLALEQHHTTHGRYPESLENPPDNRATILPQDPYSGNPILCRVVEGRPRLSSVGPNRQDDTHQPDASSFDDIVWVVAGQ
ncbi:MAG: hypothetical protein ACKV19_21655 [Verrucomicrobiales bacterium]